MAKRKHEVDDAQPNKRQLVLDITDASTASLSEDDDLQNAYSADGIEDQIDDIFRHWVETTGKKIIKRAVKKELAKERVLKK
jgi:hypothetical protein